MSGGGNALPAAVRYGPQVTQGGTPLPRTTWP